MTTLCSCSECLSAWASVSILSTRRLSCDRVIGFCLLEGCLFGSRYTQEEKRRKVTNRLIVLWSSDFQNQVVASNEADPIVGGVSRAARYASVSCAIVIAIAFYLSTSAFVPTTGACNSDC